MCALLQAFGFEPSCTLCTGFHLAFDTHTTSQKHFQVVHDLVRQSSELARAGLWHETCVVGGQVRYNLLDGELQVLRDLPLPDTSVTSSQQVSFSGQWILIGAAVVVPVQTRPSGRRCGPSGTGKSKWNEL